MISAAGMTGDLEHHLGGRRGRGRGGEGEGDGRQDERGVDERESGSSNPAAERRGEQQADQRRSEVDRPWPGSGMLGRLRAVLGDVHGNAGPLRMGTRAITARDEATAPTAPMAHMRRRGIGAPRSVATTVVGVKAVAVIAGPPGGFGCRSLEETAVAARTHRRRGVERAMAFVPVAYEA